MKDREEDREMNYQLRLNCIENDSFLGISYRKWVDTFVFGGAVFLIIMVIPFTSLVTTILLVTIMIPTIMLCIHGICNRSVSEMLFAEMRFRKNKRVLHLRGPEYVRQKTDFSKYAGGDETNGERIVRTIKESLNRYADSILEGEDSKNN